MKIITQPPCLIKKYMDCMGFRGLAMPFTNTIYIRGREYMNDRLIRHEKKHLEQMREEGTILFLIKYNWYWITVGYEKNPYEIEARKAEQTLPHGASKKEEEAWEYLESHIGDKR